jgi:hypothetical protein
MPHLKPSNLAIELKCPTSSRQRRRKGATRRGHPSAPSRPGLFTQLGMDLARASSPRNLANLSQASTSGRGDALTGARGHVSVRGGPSAGDLEIGRAPH